MDKIDLSSFENEEEELAKLDPADLRYLSQLLAEDPSTVKRVIKNVLEEPIPETAQKRLKPPLQPKPFQPIPPPRNRNKRQLSETI